MALKWSIIPEVWSATNKIFCHFAPFLHFYPYRNNLKMKLLKKMEKTPGDIIILHMCTINANHMMYGSWDIERDGHNVLSFWTIFRPFTTPATQKIKILKK